MLFFLAKFPSGRNGLGITFFRGWKAPLSVLLCIPFTFIGSVLGMIAFKKRSMLAQRWLLLTDRSNNCNILVTNMEVWLMVRGKQDIENRYQAILEAAYTLFGTAGFAGTSMKDIAVKAGVAQGLIVYHFRSKEKLLLEVVKEWMLNRGLPDVAKHLEQVKGPVNIIKAAIDHVASFRNHHPEWFTLLISLWLESRQNANLAAELAGIYEGMRVGICRELDKLNLGLEPSERDALAATIQAIFDGLTLQSATQQGDLIAGQGAVGLSMLLRGASFRTGM